MPDFERIHRFFRGGTRLNGPSFGRLIRDDLLLLLADVFNLLLYKKIDSRPSSRPIDCIYTDNEMFWRDALNKKHFQAMRIGLHGFHLMEWLPSAPGRYFTPHAPFSRRVAETREYDPILGEYLPDGKSHMVRGGIGSLRLGAKRIGPDTMYFLGASSTGISHQGIPVVLHEMDYAQLIGTIHAYGGCVANVVGTLQIFQSSVMAQDNYNLRYDQKVPRYCLVVDRVDTVRPSDTSILLATVAIIFPASIETTVFKKAWSYASFNPGLAGNLDAAVEWLKSYVERYSHVRHAPILTDFDEHYQHFSNPVEFPLGDVFSGTVDVDRFEDYKTYWGFDLDTPEKGITPRYKHDSKALYADSLPFWQPPPSYLAANIFLSYAHEDEYLVTELKKHLMPLQKTGHINMWYDREIVAGKERGREISEQLNKAHIILLLVSPDYINSEYCYGVEMRHAMERHLCGTARVIPIILRPVYWQGMPFGSLQALPKAAKPVTDSSWHNLDSALYAVAEGVRRVAQQLITTLLTPTPALPVQVATTARIPSEQSTKPEEYTLLRTLKSASALAIRPDNQVLVCRDYEGAVKLWNLHTGQLLHTLTSRSGSIRSIVMSPDGKTLVSASQEGAIELWTLHTGQFLHTLKEPHAHDLRFYPIGNLVISPDGQMLLFRDNCDKTIRLWSLRTGEEQCSVHGIKDPPLVVSPDWKSLFGPGPDETIKQWNMQTGELIRTLTGHEHKVRFLASSSDGQRLASGGLRTIKIWDTRTGQLLHTLKSDAFCIECMAMSADGQRLVCGNRFSQHEGSVSLWDLSSGQCLHTFTTLAYPTSAVIGPGSQLLIWGIKGEIEVWGRVSRASQG